MRQNVAQAGLYFVSSSDLSAPSSPSSFCCDFVYVWIHVHVCTHICVRVHRHVRPTLFVILQEATYLAFETVSFPGLELTSVLSWTASEPQGLPASVCLALGLEACTTPPGFYTGSRN